MSRLVQCNRCGKQVRDPYRGVPEEERAAVSAEYHSFYHLSVEANEDVDNADFCSWQCLAEWSMAKAMSVSASTGGAA